MRAFFTLAIRSCCIACSSRSGEVMPSTEQTAKAQFAKVFTAADWRNFKLIADRYFERSARLRKADMLAFPAGSRLLARNIEKRLFIGIGMELLLKSLYLKHGFVINKAVQDSQNVPQFPFSKEDADAAGVTLEPRDTYNLNDLIQCLHRVPAIGALGPIETGLRVAKVFRNKEGHVVVGAHKFNATEYTEVEKALVRIYDLGFDQTLEVTISMKPYQKARWKLS